MDIKNAFNDFVGLKNTKKRLGFYLENYKNTNVCPNLLLYCSKGRGKTSMARNFAKFLTEKGNKDRIKKLIEINCSTLDNVDSFFNVVNNHLIDCSATIFMDECEALPNDLSLALCTILNPNKENINRFNYQSVDYTFDFSLLTFLFASTEINKIHHALLDRLNVIDFDNYELQDLAELIARNLKNYKINLNTLNNVAGIIRGNPRHAIKVSNDIIAFLRAKNKNEFGDNEWKEIKSSLGLHEYGLTDSEIRVLRILKDNPNGASLTKIAGILGSTTENTRKFVEIFPLKMGLFEVKPSVGRILTVKGEQVLQNLNKIE